jgi:hypothetical protein
VGRFFGEGFDFKNKKEHRVGVLYDVCCFRKRLVFVLEVFYDVLFGCGVVFLDESTTYEFEFWFCRQYCGVEGRVEYVEG